MGKTSVDHISLWAGGEGETEDEMAGWHHRLSGHEFEQYLGDCEVQGSLLCCTPRGCTESDMTATELKLITSVMFIHGQ